MKNVQCYMMKEKITINKLVHLKHLSGMAYFSNAHNKTFENQVVVDTLKVAFNTTFNIIHDTLKI